MEPKNINRLETAGPTRAGGDSDEPPFGTGRLLGNHIEPPVVNPWIVQDGPYWRSRAEALRMIADETDTFRPETRARMLRIAKDYDLLAERAEKRFRGVKCARPSNGASRTAPDGRGREGKQTTATV